MPPPITGQGQAGLMPGGKEGKGPVGKWYRCGFHTNLLRLLETKFESQGTHKALPAPGFHLLNAGGSQSSKARAPAAWVVPTTPVNFLNPLPALNAHYLCILARSSSQRAHRGREAFG